MTRPDREDLTRQHEAVESARATMARACDTLRAEANAVSRTLWGKGRLASVDVLTAMTTGIAGAVARVDQAEEDLAFALTDLATARGEDL